MPWNNLNGAGTWTGTNWMAVAGGKRIDPYMLWAEASGFADSGGIPASGVPVLIELDARTTIPAFAAMIDRLGWLAIPAIYTMPSALAAVARYFSASASAAFFQQFAAGNALLADVIRFEIGIPVCIETNVSHAGIDGTAFPTVATVASASPIAVIAVIDDGLPFANSRYFDAGSTRVRFFWDQTMATGGVSATAAAGAPPDLGYGCELTEAHIQAALAAAASGGNVDEEMLYARAGYSRVRRRQTHGSAVMDLACGPNPPAINRIPGAAANAPDPAIIGVQLPSLTVADTSGASLGVHLLDGLRYIIARADTLGTNLPIVVNLSFGRIAGAPDGTSLICEAMDELIAALGGRLRIVVAAGNNYLSRAHARFALVDPPKPTQQLSWRVQPGDETPNFMEIWVPDAGKADFSSLRVEIRPPGFVAGTPPTFTVGANQAFAWSPVTGGAPLCSIVFTTRPAGAGIGWAQILIAMEPTASLSPRGLAPFGLWSVVVEYKGKDALHFDAWIQRDDTPYGYARRGRQSYFDDPDYDCFDRRGQRCEVDNSSHVKREGTLNALARGSSVDVVGASIGLTAAGPAATATLAAFATGAVAGGPPAKLPLEVANYSSAGQVVRNIVRSPNHLAPSEDSIVQHGVLAAGTHSNSFSALAGTSVAAPQISWYLATGAPLAAVAVAAAAAVVARQRDAAGNSIAALPTRGPAIGTIGRRVTRSQRGFP